MISYALEVGSKTFFPQVPIEITKSAIIAAVRAGGDFVVLSSSGLNSSVLISPGLCVIVREISSAADAVATLVNTPEIAEILGDFDEWSL